MNFMVVAKLVHLSLAAETWIATALLHRENPDREDFSIQEIVARARSEKLTASLRSGVQVHASTHCVANREPKPAQLRMLYATGKRTRRLFREGDEAHPKRHGKVTPDPESIPPEYRYLLDWYANEYSKPRQDTWLKGLFEMAGAGKKVFAGIDPDEYVRQLRQDWD
jgi:hypothetical protein